VLAFKDAFLRGQAAFFDGLDVFTGVPVRFLVPNSFATFSRNIFLIIERARAIPSQTEVPKINMIMFPIIYRLFTANSQRYETLER
jgi:hypothetical protein